MVSSAPGTKPHASLPITVLLQLNRTLRKSLFSRTFYQEVNDKVLAKTATLDSTLYFICYFSLLLSSVLSNKHRVVAFVRAQRGNLTRVLARICPQACGQQLRLQSANPEEQATQTCAEGHEKSLPEVADESMAVAGKLAQAAVHLKAVSAYIADVRIFHRLVEAIRYMPWIIDEFSALTSPVLAVPRLDRLVNLGQAINCLVLELLENAGWLTDHNWIGTRDNSYWCTETYIWSSRVWGVYIAVEILELLRRYPASKRDRNWKINLFTQAVQLPLVLHWSLYEGCLTPFWVGLCGTGASWLGFKRVMDSIDLS